MAKEKISGIYKIENLIDGKVYIGQSINILRRLADHKSSLKYNRHHNGYLQRAYNKYGKENTEILKLCFANIVYLLSQDIDTLEEISNLCGKTCEDGIVKPLISVEELKTLRVFEAIILIPRIMPIKTKLLPHYEMKKI